ncbi:MAG: KamA family radical SAM protein [Pirellulales bacterium]|nr:KamA family radical SAM protein [Pirellulales bacterium]
MQPSERFTRDPLGEAEHLATPGLLWKYCGRILILTTGDCGVHCRFCFRRHFRTSPLSLWERDGVRAEKWTEDKNEILKRNIQHSTSRNWHFAPCPHPGPLPEGEGNNQVTLEKIAAEPSLREVILSGGDPLVIPDFQLEVLVKNLEKIPHLRRLRIHTRLPVMIPGRITEELLRVLRSSRLTPVMVIHVNHPAEIDADVAAALSRLVETGVPLLSQGVLLRGVNDQAEILAELYERLVELRVMPYYLHQLDPVAGAAHFEVPIDEGIRIIRQLRDRLPGYAVPRYVREIRGEKSKEILA